MLRDDSPQSEPWWLFAPTNLTLSDTEGFSHKFDLSDIEGAERSCLEFKVAL